MDTVQAYVAAVLEHVTEDDVEELWESSERVAMDAWASFPAMDHETIGALGDACLTDADVRVWPVNVHVVMLGIVKVLEAYSAGTFIQVKDDDGDAGVKSEAGGDAIGEAEEAAAKEADEDEDDFENDAEARKRSRRARVAAGRAAQQKVEVLPTVARDVQIAALFYLGVLARPESRAMNVWDSWTSAAVVRIFRAVLAQGKEADVAVWQEVLLRAAGAWVGREESLARILAVITAGKLGRWQLDYLKATLKLGSHDAVCKSLVGMLTEKGRAASERRSAEQFVCKYVMAASPRAVQTLLQHMCIQCTETADGRSRVATSFATITDAWPAEKADAQRTSAAVFLARLARNSKSHFRLLALDIGWAHVHRFLGEVGLPPRDATPASPAPGDVTDESMDVSVIGADGDEDAAVKTEEEADGVKTEASVDGEAAQPAPKVEIVGATPKKRVVSTAYQLAMADLLAAVLGRCSDKVATVRHKGLVLAKSIYELPVSVLEEKSDASDEAPWRTVMARVFVRRIDDEKAVVRKAAVQALEAMACAGATVDGVVSFAQAVDAIVSRTADVSLLVRTQAANSLTAVLESVDAGDERTKRAVGRRWLQGVLPLLGDLEASIQDKAVDLFDAHAFMRLAKADAVEWTALFGTIVGDGALLKLTTRFFALRAKRAAGTMSVPAAILKAAQKRIRDGGETTAAWMVLAECVAATKGAVAAKIDAKLVKGAWRALMVKDPTADASTRYILRVLPAVVRAAGGADEQLVEDMQALVLRFTMPPNVAGALVQAVAGLHADRDGWVAETSATCVAFLESCIASCRLPEADVIARLFVLGEVHAQGTAAAAARAVSTVQAFISGVLIPPAVLGPQANAITVPPTVQGHAFIALGKLCLLDTGLAKKCIAMLAGRLETAEEAVVRNNILVVLTDMCIRYPAVVDPYMGTVALGLSDASPLVRHQTVALLSRLVQEDYVKWKGSLFFDYIAVLADRSQNVRALADYHLRHQFVTKWPGLAASHIVECIFVLNDYAGHRVYNRFGGGGTTAAARRASRMLTNAAGGPSAPARRMHVYATLLQLMTDEQKFRLMGTLCSDVLAGVLDAQDGLSMDGAGAAVLDDVLRVLNSADIRLSTSTRRANGAGGVDDDAPVDAAAAARGRLLTKIFKKSIIDSMVPVLVELKELFERHQSKLLDPLLTYMQAIFADFADVIADLRVTNPQLIKEIEFDMRRREQIARTPRKQAANVSRLMADDAPEPRATATTKVVQATMATPRKRTPGRMARTPGGTVTVGFAVPRLRKSIAAKLNPAGPVVTVSKGALVRGTMRSRPDVASAAASPLAQDSPLQRQRAMLRRKRKRLGADDDDESGSESESESEAGRTRRADEDESSDSFHIVYDSDDEALAAGDRFEFKTPMAVSRKSRVADAFYTPGPEPRGENRSPRWNVKSPFVVGKVKFEDEEADQVKQEPAKRAKKAPAKAKKEPKQVFVFEL